MPATSAPSVVEHSTAAVGNARSRQRLSRRRHSVEGLAALHRGAYVEAIELLVPVRFDLWRIGGGRAQRDVVDWTLTGAAVRNAERS